MVRQPNLSLRQRFLCAAMALATGFAFNGGAQAQTPQTAPMQAAPMQAAPVQAAPVQAVPAQIRADSQPQQNAPSDGVFCMQDQDELRLLAIRPEQNNAMRFSVSLWWPNSDNFAAYGVANPVEGQQDQWLYSNGQTGEHACNVSIRRTQGGFLLEEDENTPCADNAGYKGHMGKAFFPAASYRYPVDTELKAVDAIQYIQACGQRPALPPGFPQ